MPLKIMQPLLEHLPICAVKDTIVFFLQRMGCFQCFRKGKDFREFAAFVQTEFRLSSQEDVPCVPKPFLITRRKPCLYFLAYAVECIVRETDGMEFYRLRFSAFGKHSSASL